MCIRLLQGIFAGAIGVGRGNIATITDPSNEGRAYAILGSVSLAVLGMPRDFEFRYSLVSPGVLEVWQELLSVVSVRAQNLLSRHGVDQSFQLKVLPPSGALSKMSASSFGTRISCLQ